MNDTHNRVMKLIKDHGDLKDEPDLTDDLEAEYGFDSLDMIELVMAAEDEFDITITDLQSKEIKTAGDLIRMVDKIKGQAAA